MRLTVEFHDDTCRVYNRCQDNIYVGTQVIGPDQVAAWPETDILQLGRDIELVLDFDDVAPSAPNNFDFDEETDAPQFEQPASVATDAKSSDGFKTMMQLVVTTTCLVVCAAMMLYKPNQNGGDGSMSTISFEKLIADARNSASTSTALIQRVQFAEAAIVRGDPETASKRFVQLRDDLIPQRDRFETEHREPELAIVQFVEKRLSDLQRELN